MICSLGLLRQRHLTIDAPDGFSSGKTVALFEAHNLCFSVCGDNDGASDSLVGPCFKKERYIVDHHGSRILSCGMFRQPGLFSCDTRVDDSFKRVQLGPVSENHGCQNTAIEGVVGVEDGRPEPFHNLAPGWLARFDDLSREQIGIDHDCAALLEHPGNGALAGRDAACEANENHGGRE